MSKRHAFDQQEASGVYNNNSNWVKFREVCDELGFVIRVTGGVVLTHEINCTKEDFEAALGLSK